ncbi:MAG TPA: hypothetical protein VFW75_05285 [Acetobacteraceae bacterium]|nr:hypothetical protein [Acetobacteraceae bacterium]
MSVALALALPRGPYRNLLLQVVYAAAVFTIVVQSLTMPWLVRRLFGHELQGRRPIGSRARGAATDELPAGPRVTDGASNQGGAPCSSTARKPSFRSR